jgi:hypothetical protein
MKPLITFFAVIALNIVLIFAQEQTKDQTNKAMQSAPTRLPEDQPKLGTSPSAAASSPTTSTTTVAPNEPTASATQPNEADMMKQMMEIAKLNENHKLLADLNGTWSYTIKFWPAPGAPPQESNGTAVRKSMMGGRYFVMDVTGKMEVPAPDGKMKPLEFKGHGIEGYDNAKQKFVATWCDNMSTGIMMAEGTYDPATKSLTYTSEYEPIPGMKQQVRETLKLTDKDHMNLEWYENRGGQEAKTMEIAYSRRK